MKTYTYIIAWTLLYPVVKSIIEDIYKINGGIIYWIGWIIYFIGGYALAR